MRHLRFLVAPNAFKGTLSPLEAAEAIARGVRSAFPGSACDLMPLADGGDGLMEVLLGSRGGRRARCRVIGPLGRLRDAEYALLSDGRTAVVEMARASGIAGIPKKSLDPLGATSFGTGELIADALARGRRRILVGLGGSATSDGGAGMAQALGARLLDASGRELPRGAQALLRLERVDAGALRRRLSGVEVIGISDVDNPLLGARGSARVYGPQKGATPAMVRELEAALGRYARVLARDLGRRVGGLSGAGAAGGMGAGLAAFLGARLERGARWVLGELGARARLAKADFAVTGEGRLDASSFCGKAPLELARLARAEGVPVWMIAGQFASGLEARLRRAGVLRVAALSRPGSGPAAASAGAAARLRRAARELAAASALCLSLLATARAGGDAFAETDRLYRHRNRPGNLEQSLATLEARIKEDPSDSEALWRLSRGLVSLGERAKDRGRRLVIFERAESVAGRSVAISSGVAEAHFWHGVALGRTGETRGIMRSLFMIGPLKRRMKLVLQLDPKHAGAHHVLGEMYRQLPGFAGGSKSQAVAELEEAVRLAPEETNHYPALAEAYLGARKRDKAVETLRRALAMKYSADPAGYEDDLDDARRMLRELGETP